MFRRCPSKQPFHVTQSGLLADLFERNKLRHSGDGKRLPHSFANCKSSIGGSMPA